MYNPAYDRILESIWKCEAKQDFLWNLVKEQKKEVIQTINNYVARHDVSESFSKILSSAYEYGCPEAEKIAYELGLDQKDFLAIEGNLEKFEELHHQEYINNYEE